MGKYSNRMRFPSKIYEGSKKYKLESLLIKFELPIKKKKYKLEHFSDL